MRLAVLQQPSPGRPHRGSLQIVAAGRSDQPLLKRFEAARKCENGGPGSLLSRGIPPIICWGDRAIVKPR